MGSTGNNKTVVTVVCVIVLLLFAGGAAGFFGMSYFERERMQEEAVERAVTEDVKGFCEALQNGDIGTASLYVSEGAATQMALDMMDVKEYRKLLLDGLSLSEEDLDDNLKESFDTFTKSLSKNVITDVSYDIGELSIVSKDRHSITATMPVRITGVGSLVNLDFSGEIALANVALANYTSENQKTLMDIYDQNGEDAVKNNLMQQELGNLFSAMNAKVKEAASDEHEWEMTFAIGKDAKGNVTSATIEQAMPIREAAADETEEAP